MLKLNNREKSIPNGLQFHISQIPNFKLPPQCSFSVAVQSIIAVRKANPYLAHKLGWKTDEHSVEEELDFYNASVCAAQNWTAYIVTDTQGATPLPKPQAAQHQSGAIAAAANTAKRIWSGVKTLNSWIDSGEPAVPAPESELRAGICVACPLNGQGGLESFFTIPASEAIKRQFTKLESRKLVTPHDEKLGVCSACSCPLKLKVHTPMHFIKDYLQPDVIAELRKGKSCWIVAAL